MKKSISTNRLTIDLTDKSKQTLEGLKENMLIPFGTITCSIIDSFCGTSEIVRKDMLTYCKKQIISLNKQLETASPFSHIELEERIEAYTKMAVLFNSGIALTGEELVDRPSMTKYELFDGCAIFPEDWIVLNASEAKESMYCCVVETTRGGDVPHFVYFTNETGIGGFSDATCHIVNELCVSKWPEFSKILDSEVKYIAGVNEEEYLAAPCVGYFTLYVKGEGDRGAHYKPPYGAYIYRHNKR